MRFELCNNTSTVLIVFLVCSVIATVLIGLEISVLKYNKSVNKTIQVGLMNGYTQSFDSGQSLTFNKGKIT